MPTFPVDEQPIFVDGTLRRRRLVVVAGAAVGATLFLVALALMSGLTSAGPQHLPDWPDAGSGGAWNAPATASPAPPAQSTPAAARKVQAGW